MGNAALAIAANVLLHVFGPQRQQHTQDNQTTEALFTHLSKWVAVACENLHAVQLDDGTEWFPTSSGAAAMQLRLVAKILLLVHPSASTSKTDGSAQACAHRIISISANHLSDAAQVQAVYSLFPAAKHANEEMRSKVISIMTELQQRTGFHTQSKVEVLENLQPKLRLE